MINTKNWSFRNEEWKGSDAKVQFNYNDNIASIVIYVIVIYADLAFCERVQGQLIILWRVAGVLLLFWLLMSFPTSIVC